MSSEQNIQVIDLFGFARRRGKLVAIIAGVIILATFWLSMALPNLYTSSAMILVEPQSVDEDLVNSGVRESDLNERLGLMTAEILSRSRLSKIIDKKDLYQDESEDLERSEVIDLMRSYVAVEPVLSELETANGPRRQELSFNTFKIIFQNEDANMARDVAQLIANDFINANIDARTNITKKSLAFMQDEIDSLSTQIEKVEKAVARVKEESPGKLPEDLAANQRLLQFAMSDLRDAERAFDAARNDAAFWKNQAVLAADFSGTNDSTSPTHRLRGLELERGNLLARGFTEKHPDVVRVESEIGLLQAQLSQRSNEDSEVAQTLPQQNAMAEERRAELLASAMGEDIERLREVVSEIETRIAGTPGVAERLDALSRQYEHLYRSYQDFSSRRQQAGVQADLERRQLGEQFRILESAYAAPEPSSPNRIVILILGTVLGLAIAFGIGFIAEMVDTSLHTSNDLQSALGIPVLVSVPKIMLEFDRTERSRRILKESLAALAVVLFCLSGGIATYFLVNGVSDTEAGNEEQKEESTAPQTEARIDLGLDFGRGTG
jgi:polysaccharide chain length determinant protein (PEP-CTERM system associated)